MSYFIEIKFLIVLLKSRFSMNKAQTEVNIP